MSAIFSLSMEMSRLTRDGTAEPVSRDQILRRERGQGNINFPCSADHVHDWQPYPVDLSLAICVTIHTYIANAPKVFQRVMSLAFAKFGKESGLLLYMDDVVACFATWEAHLRLLQDMFRAFQAAGSTLKPPEIHFEPKEVHYLGHVLSSDGMRIGEDRSKAIVGLKMPTTIKELQTVLGTLNFVRKFIPDMATALETRRKFEDVTKLLGS